LNNTRENRQKEREEEEERKREKFHVLSPLFERSFENRS
jgi:hypothetical protein